MLRSHGAKHATRRQRAMEQVLPVSSPELHAWRYTRVEARQVGQVAAAGVAQSAAREMRRRAKQAYAKAAQLAAHPSPVRPPARSRKPRTNQPRSDIAQPSMPAATHMRARRCRKMAADSARSQKARLLRREKASSTGSRHARGMKQPQRWGSYSRGCVARWWRIALHTQKAQQRARKMLRSSGRSQQRRSSAAARRTPAFAVPPSASADRGRASSQ